MYIVVELQTQPDGTCANLVFSFEREDEARSKFHQILSYAAVSNLPMHSAVILTNEGVAIAHECYTHEPAPEE